MSQKIEEHFACSMVNSANKLLAFFQLQYPQFAGNLIIQSERLDSLQVNFTKNIKEMKSKMQSDSGKVVLDRHKLSSCAVKAIVETKIFKFIKRGIGAKKFPTILAFANEFFAFIFVPTIVDAFRVVKAQSSNIPIYTFPIVYGGNSEMFTEECNENYHYFDEVFCRFLFPYRKRPKSFPMFEFSVLLCSLNTAWNCYRSEKACAFYYEFGRGN